MRDLHTVILWEDAVRMFERDILPNIRQTERRNGSKGIDSCMRSEAWNNWTDGLCKAGNMRTGHNLRVVRRNQGGKNE